MGHVHAHASRWLLAGALLLAASIALALPAAATAAQIEGEALTHVFSGKQDVVPSPLALWGGGKVRRFLSNGAAGGWLKVSKVGDNYVSIGMRGTKCTKGWPTAQVALYSYTSKTWVFNKSGIIATDKVTRDPNARFFPYYTGGVLKVSAAGWYWVYVAMANDSYSAGVCDANLEVDYVYVG